VWRFLTGDFRYEFEEWPGEAFAMAAEDTEFREDEEPAALIETGRALVRRYIADPAPSSGAEASQCRHRNGFLVALALVSNRSDSIDAIIVKSMSVLMWYAACIRGDNEKKFREGLAEEGRCKEVLFLRSLS